MPGADARLRILATSDLHMHLTGFDYGADRPDPARGLTRIASLIATARDEAARDSALVLLFDNGDGMQGTPMDEPAAAPGAGPHPLMRAFDHLRYDAIGLGNHDFDFGLEALERALAAAPCPALCANLRPKGTALPAGLRPRAILDRRTPDGAPLRIGVFSVLPPQTGIWNRALLAGRVGFDDIVQSAAREADALRQAGCDLVIALAHTGPEPDNAAAKPMAENALRTLAALPGVDVALGGHSHEAQTWDDPDRPAVMPGYAGSHLGVIDLALARTAGGWTVARATAALRPVTRRDSGGHLQPLAAEDPALARLIAPAHEATRTALRTPIGQSAHPLHSYFSFFAPDRALALVAAAQAAALRPHLVGTEAEGLPLLSAAAPGKTGGRGGPTHYTDVPAGPLRLRHLCDLSPFPNTLAGVVLTGAQIRDWLEQAAGQFHQIAPGSTDAPLTDPLLPGHGFDVLHGLSYAVDVTAAPLYTPDGTPRPDGAGRIRDLAWNGRPLAPDQRFAVALNGYRAAGGGAFAALRGVRPIPLPSLRIGDALRDYIAGELPRDPLETAPPPWRLAPVPKTTAILQTGLGARTHLGELAGRGIIDLGRDPDGFLRLRLPLG
ncbi:5'-nucleotidase C-terminal domain-containing protein [Aquicoccus sp. SU-CL01552]|uniref:5'-nucleotidase C-terminal domain-containing protein n=1 Tax=Aquicoccus sp. SU-CL01552 TaxID=3127656 RepID=UPI0031051254